MRDGTHALDPAHLSSLCPLALAHVRLRVVDPECSDADQNVAVAGNRIGQLADLQHVGSTVLADHDCAQLKSFPSVGADSFDARRPAAHQLTDNSVEKH